MTDFQNQAPSRLDDELAELTDALLRGDETRASGEAVPLLEMAYRLDDLIAPRERPGADAEARLRLTAESAWNQRVTSRKKRAISWGWDAGVGAAAAALILVVLLIPPEATFPLLLSGAAAESGAAAAEISWRDAVFVVGTAGLVVYLLYRLRRQRFA
ncbi:MAG TPA: hypothetical protein VER79_01220 [Candidatus Limnocylindrales bacterium]|nr:hypothetical protein [Candidatus Limnocylindrales bacterium]